VRIQSDAAINRRRLRRGGPCAEGWRKDGLDYSVAGGAVAADGSMEPRIPAAAWVDGGAGGWVNRRAAEVLGSIADSQLGSLLRSLKIVR
jgi:hypothetical protein